jgi:hypothetical protein
VVEFKRNSVQYFIWILKMEDLSSGNTHKLNELTELYAGSIISVEILVFLLDLNKTVK